MNNNLNDVFTTTISGLERAFVVQDITSSPLITCKSEEELSQFLEKYPEFDIVPLEQDGQIVAIIEKDSQIRKPIDISMLVSAEESLLNFLPYLEQQSFYLVLKGTEIHGIVTRSDVIKLPVRLLIFTLVTHLEMVMSDIIKNEGGKEDEWKKHLSKDQLNRLKGLEKKLRSENINPSLIELTYFDDKFAIVGKIRSLGAHFESEMKSIQNLRNTIDHSKEYAQNETALKEFLCQMERTDHWIKYFSN